MYKDFLETLLKSNQFLVFGFQDIKVKYRRSSIGVFWQTINMSIYILVLSFVFGLLLNNEIKNFIPYLSLGLILWGFISTNINESCNLFIEAKENILNLKVNFSFYILRAIWRNVIILTHNFLIIPIVFYIFGKTLVIANFFYFALGFILLILNLTWMMMLCAIICTRFRDFSQIILNLVQITFYLTPILWTQDNFKSTFIENVLILNPFYHIFEITRSVLIGKMPNSISWIASIVFLILGSIIASYFFKVYKNKIVYWL